MFLWMEHLSCMPASSGLAWKQLGGVEQTGCNLCLQAAIPGQHVNHVSWQSLLFGSRGHLSLWSDWALAWYWTAAPLQLPSRVGCASSTAAQSSGCSARRVSCPHAAKTGASCYICLCALVNACLVSFLHLEKVEKIDGGLCGSFCTEAPSSNGVCLSEAEPWHV